MCTFNIVLTFYGFGFYNGEILGFPPTALDLGIGTTELGPQRVVAYPGGACHYRHIPEKEVFVYFFVVVYVHGPNLVLFP